jgi:hypothetical protein
MRNSFAILILVACVISSVANTANAYYVAQLGRWLTRDPAADVMRMRMESPPIIGAGRAFLVRDSQPSGSSCPLGRCQSGDFGRSFGQVANAAYAGGVNLYQYVLDRPTTLVDPSGLLADYGNYCGSANKGGMPVDGLDTCCLQHDRCYEKCGGASGVCGVFSPSRCRRKCDAELCGCAAMSDCEWGIGCNAYRAALMGLFCSNAGHVF